MARKCAVTGKGVQFGNTVSHANNKARRRWLPNLQSTSLLSDILGASVTMRVTTNGIRTIEHNGGLDAWLLGTKDTALTHEARQIKKRILKAQEKKAKASA
jgi:large subunit ribosomal protein L28